MSFMKAVFFWVNIGTITYYSFALPANYLQVQKCDNGMLGIQMTNQTIDTEDSPAVKYVFPVTNMGAHHAEEGGKNVIGMIPLNDFYLEMMPLKSFLQDYTLPSYMKLLLVKAKERN